MNSAEANTGTAGADVDPLATEDDLENALTRLEVGHTQPSG